MPSPARVKVLALSTLMCVAAGCGSSPGTVMVRAHAKTVTVRQRAADAPRAAALPRVVQPPPGASVPHLQALVPPDASVLNAWTLPAAGGVPEQLAVTWVRQTHPHDYPEHALVIWERSYDPRTGTTWRRIYLLDAYRFAKKIDVVDIAAQVADVTGDGHLDVLAYQAGDGSGGCGTYDLLATSAGRVRDVDRSLECFDDAVIALRSDDLVIDRGFQYAPHGRHVHPVFRTWRRTVKRWDGHRLVTVRRYVIVPSRRVSGPYGRGG